MSARPAHAMAPQVQVAEINDRDRPSAAQGSRVTRPRARTPGATGAERGTWLPFPARLSTAPAYYGVG